MKKHFFKKIALMLAAVVTVASVNVPASAAAVKPELKSKQVSVQVGQTKSYGIKNTTEYSVKFVVGNEKIAKIKTIKGGKEVKVTGVTAGETKLRAEFTNNRTKAVIISKIPVVVSKKTVTKTVSTQKALNIALKNTAVTKIVLKTNAEKKFTIGAGNYGKVAFVVDAPKADVENKGVFKSVKIKNIKPSTWTEKAKGNNIVVTAKEARVIVAKGASVGNITLSQNDAKIAVEVNGTVKQVVLDAKVDVALSGEAENVKVEVAETAKGSEVTASVPLALTTAVEISTKLEAGAEGSKIEVSDAKINVTVDNKTTQVVEVKNPEGSQNVNVGQAVNTGNNDRNNNNSNNSGNSTGGNSGGSKPVTARYEFGWLTNNLSITKAEDLSNEDISISYRRKICSYYILFQKNLISPSTDGNILV